jgi:NhaA family Na+:H+ antiporter
MNTDFSQVPGNSQETVDRCKRSYPLESLFGRILSPFEQFLQRTTAGGMVLMGTTVLTLMLSNSPMGKSIQHVWEEQFRIVAGSWHLEMSLHKLINEGFMALFFLMVGLELKREVLVGELSSLREAALPVIAAVGGMVVPALLYHLLNPEGPAAPGWGVPMATDIAFAIGILVLLAWRIPPNLVIFLTALAIADDLGAVLIIAIYYTQNINPTALGSAVGALFILALFNRGGIRHPLPYTLLGLVLWFNLLQSGVHATIAGVLLALTIPARPAFSPFEFKLRLNQLQEGFHVEDVDCETTEPSLRAPLMAITAGHLESAAKAVQSPLQRMEHSLSPLVTFLVVPIFALSNAGIDFARIQLASTLVDPTTLGIILGLVLGKFLGISGFSWLAVHFGICKLPGGVRWRHLLGAAWLGGIGFTMSLFISQLAFQDPQLIERAKLGILVASAISAGIGVIWLFRRPRKRDRNRRTAGGMTKASIGLWRAPPKAGQGKTAQNAFQYRIVLKTSLELLWALGLDGGHVPGRRGDGVRLRRRWHGWPRSLPPADFHQDPRIS